MEFSVTIFRQLKGVLAISTKPMYQSGWQLMIIHGKYSRLHACFDKVNNGPKYKTLSK